MLEILETLLSATLIVIAGAILMATVLIIMVLFGIVSFTLWVGFKIWLWLIAMILVIKLIQWLIIK